MQKQVETMLDGEFTQADWLKFEKVPIERSTDTRTSGGASRNFGSILRKYWEWESPNEYGDADRTG